MLFPFLPFMTRFLRPDVDEASISEFQSVYILYETSVFRIKQGVEWKFWGEGKVEGGKEDGEMGAKVGGRVLVRSEGGMGELKKGGV